MHNVSNRLDFFMYRGFTTRHLLFNKYLKKRANITDSLYIDLHSDIASLGETIEPDVSYPKNWQMRHIISLEIWELLLNTQTNMEP